uniref:Uncharacterized protein n=1 Tax=Lactuca sativa TaxID=4236 RepID=A0A9R1XIT3_LACSA|nr:hypothetical protein LSAT_V11C300127410 [Lactuca sativa]
MGFFQFRSFCSFNYLDEVRTTVLKIVYSGEFQSMVDGSGSHSGGGDGFASKRLPIFGLDSNFELLIALNPIKVFDEMRKQEQLCKFEETEEAEQVMIPRENLLKYMFHCNCECFINLYVDKKDKFPLGLITASSKFVGKLNVSSIQI